MADKKKELRFAVRTTQDRQIIIERTSCYGSTESTEVVHDLEGLIEFFAEALADEERSEIEKLHDAISAVSTAGCSFVQRQKKLVEERGKSDKEQASKGDDI